jgi:dephospho-CoA kinase
VLDIPLLLEGRAARGADPARARTASDLVSEVIVVYAPESTQIERQVARDGATREHAAERVRAQLSIEEKRKLADHVIDNSGSLADTERQVNELHAKLTAP